MPNKSSCPYFVVGGTLTGNAASYVERRADTELFAALQAGEYCYVLDTRQVGKSSLIVRAAQRLNAAGRITTFLDLSTFGDAPTEEQWYGKLLADLVRALDLEDEADVFWESNTRYSGAQRWFLAMRDLVLPRLNAPLVVFVDEIETVRKLPFTSDGFFAMIRALYNLRATEPASERLTFCLAGVATPADLIREPRTTPFNIGRRIALRDFDPDEMTPLAQGLPGSFDQQQEQIRSIGRWTSGHPYLTQRFCQAAAEQERPLTRQEIDTLCVDVFLHKQAQSEEANLHFVRRQLLDDPEPTDLLMRYYRLLSGKRVEVGSVDTLTDRLLLSGIAVIDPDQETPCLKVRNSIYARVFDRRWVRLNLPDAEQRRQRQALRLGYIRASVLWAALAASLLFALARQYEVRLQRKSILQLGDRLTTTNKKLHEKDEALSGRDQELAKRKSAISKATRRLKSLAVENEKQRAEQQRLHGSLLNLSVDSLRQRTQLKKTRAEQRKAVASLEEIDAKRQGAHALMGSLVSGDEFEALAYGLKAVAPALKRHQAPTPEAMQGLAHAAMAGVYRLFRLKSTFRLETATFSPDGKWVITAGWSHDLFVWNAQTGQLRSQVQVLPADISEPRVWTAEFSPNGRYLVTLGNDRTAHVWEFATLFAPAPHPVWSLPCGEESVSKAVACFSASSLYLAASGRSHGDNCATVWKIPADTAVSAPTQISVFKHTGEIESLDFNNKRAESQERYLAVAGSEDASVRIFDFLSHEEAFPYPQAKSDNTTQTKKDDVVPAIPGDARQAIFAFWNDSLYSAGDDGTVRTWGWHNALGAFPAAEGVYKTYVGHEGTVSSLAVSGDGCLMASAGLKDYKVNIWYREFSPHPVYTLTSHTADVTSVRFSTDNNYLVTASYDTTAEVWLLAKPLYCGSATALTSLAIAPDGSTIAAPTASAFPGGPGKVHLWPTAWTGIGKRHADRWELNVMGQTAKNQFPGAVYHAAYSPDGRHLATAAEQGSIRIWSLASITDAVRPYRELQGQKPYKINCVAFSPDNRFLLSADDNDNATLWNIQTGGRIILFPHPDIVSCCAFSPDGKQILTGCVDGAIRLFDLNGTVLRIMQMPGSRGRAVQRSPWSVAFSATGKWLLSGDSDGNAYLWDRDTGNHIATLPYQHGQVFSAQFSADGMRVVTVGNGGYAEIWNVLDVLKTSPNGGPAVPWISVRINSAPLYGGQFSPDGKYIFIAGKDCMARRIPATIETFVQEAQEIRRMGGKPVFLQNRSSD